MAFLKDLKEIWRTAVDRKRKQLEQYRIEYAFTSGGTKYYQFADITQLPYERGLMALDVYNEVDMRCSREFLQKFTEAMDTQLNSKNINIHTIYSLNEVLKQRLAMATDVDLLYKLASVAYFDSTENPLKYDHKYAEKKIAKWRKDNEVADFFMQKPLLELMPFCRKFGKGIRHYSEVSKELNELHSSILLMLSSIEKSKNKNDGKM